MLSLIAAVGKRGEIGLDGKLPWYIPEDLKRFRQITRNKTVIMGRITFESILQSLGSPLPDRKNIVITSNQDYVVPEGCLVFHSLETAIKVTLNENEVFIIGGAKLYEKALPYVHRMYITYINHEFEADTFFPEIDLTKWKITETQFGRRTEAEPYNCSYMVYERI